MSRLTQVRPALRPAMKARMMLAGPAGAGKTLTALTVATTLAAGGDIVVIDTENDSALTYADEFKFEHLRWAAPYDPRELTPTITEAGHSYSVVMVDSLSHFWRKSGGTLDIAAGKFTGWKAARPAQEDLVEAVMNCGAHVLLCVRSKMAHTQEDDGHGKQVVKKLGMAPQQDDDLEYELNVACELDMEHRLTVSKSRTTVLPVGRSFTAGHAEDLARIYAEWLAGGEPPANDKEVTALKERLNALTGSDRSEFKQAFGHPDHLTVSRLETAKAFVADVEAKAAS